MIEKGLAGPVGVFVKFSTLQDLGVDKVFFLENDNVDASQKSVIFLAHGEKATQSIAIAGECVHDYTLEVFGYFHFRSRDPLIIFQASIRSTKHVQWDKK